MLLKQDFSSSEKEGSESEGLDMEEGGSDLGPPPEGGVAHQPKKE